MFSDLPFPVDVVRSSRRKKTVQISLTETGIQVRVPQACEDDWIAEFVRRKVPAIKRQLEKRANQASRVHKQFASGESWRFLGDVYRLAIDASETHGCFLKPPALTVTLPDPSDTEAVRAQVTEWYLSKAAEYLHLRVAALSAEIGVTPRHIKVRDYRSRWGSCSKDGRLTFNYRLIQAPRSVVDYVVIHELCHMIELNHSARFWALVEQHMPTYHAPKGWLKQFGSQLHI